ncbi:MAG: 30S ribosomal protein S17 [Patescibacteria group bacterium]
MKKIFEGIIVSNKMVKTVVVNITSKTTHPIYKKLIKIDKKIKADNGSFSPNLGDRVKIVETKPISKDKHFKIMEVIQDGSA